MTSIKDFEQRLGNLESKMGSMVYEIERLTCEVQKLRKELGARGIKVAEMARNPKRTRLSPGAYKVLRGANAAIARGAKPVGTGRGAVSSEAVKRRLQEAAEERIKKAAAARVRKEET